MDMDEESFPLSAADPPYSTPNRQRTYAATSSSSVFMQAVQDDINDFSEMARADYKYGSSYQSLASTRACAIPEIHDQHDHDYKTSNKSLLTESTQETTTDGDSEAYSVDEAASTFRSAWQDRLGSWKQLEARWIDWLTENAVTDANGQPIYPRTMAGWVRLYLYDPALHPDFCHLQLLCWSVLLGVVVGIYVAVWKPCIEHGLKLVWRTIPQALVNHGILQQHNLVWYTRLCPSLINGTLKAIMTYYQDTIKPPNQVEWIHKTHASGYHDPSQAVYVVALSTLALWSGISVGPELPLVVVGSMLGSVLGGSCRQSILTCRVLGLVASSAMVAAFFGLPIAGAFFVLELPHTCGLQYHEALVPAVVASVTGVATVSVLTNSNPVGTFEYPYLGSVVSGWSLYLSICFWAVFAVLLGRLYEYVVKHYKKVPHRMEELMSQESPVLVAADVELSRPTETSPLVLNRSECSLNYAHRQHHRLDRFFCRLVKNQIIASFLVGFLTSLVIGWIGSYIPHAMFWGEAQLQTLIDNGQTPLPFFGDRESVTAGLTLGYCMIDSLDAAAVEAGYSSACSALIVLSKMVSTGLSLGLGIPGGHFWAPLHVGCAASNLFTNAISKLSGIFGLMSSRGYASIVKLCIMGAVHAVTYRTILSTSLILLLTTKGLLGAYSLASACTILVCLITTVILAVLGSWDTGFYREVQRDRGDIVAMPEVLCEPGKEGRPMAPSYDFGPAFGLHHRRPNAASPANNGFESMGLSSALHGSTEDSSLERRSTTRSDGLSDRSVSSVSSRCNFVRVTSFGEVTNHQPSLLDQARTRSASSEPRHRRNQSITSSVSSMESSEGSPTLFERTCNQVLDWKDRGSWWLHTPTDAQVLSFDV